MNYADISFLLYSPLRLLSFCPAIFPIQVRHYSLFHQHKQSDNHQDVAAVAGGFPLLQAPAPGCALVDGRLQVRYLPNDSLLTSRRGAVWNFPAFRKGRFTASIRFNDLATKGHLMKASV